MSHRTGPLYIHHIPIGLLETIKESRGQVIRDSMGQHVRGFFIFYVFLREVQSWIMNITLQLATYMYVCVTLPRALTYHNLQDRVATIKFIATGHAGTTQPCRTIALQKINNTGNKLYMRGAP